jgi:ribosomal protein S18 acetylase RimI-like enzyme
VIDIVAIREEHIESFHATLDAVARERRYLARLEAPPLETTREFVRRTIAKGWPHLVAVEDGRLIGWCDVIPNERQSATHCGMLGIGLLPSVRGQGIGKRLLCGTLEAARAFGLLRVELMVRVDNSNAIALYERAGFQVEGRRRRASCVDSVFHDVFIMAVLFDEAPPWANSVRQTR